MSASGDMSVPLSAPTKNIPREGVLWIPQWPVESYLAQHPTFVNEPIVVHQQDAILSLNDLAEGMGLRRGQGLKRARYIAPNAKFLSRDGELELLEFEQVIRVTQNFFAEQIVLRPGLLNFSFRRVISGGGEVDVLIQDLIEAIAEETGYEAHIGGGENLLSAILAARDDLILCGFQNSERYLRECPINALLEGCFQLSVQKQMAQFVATLQALGVYRINDLLMLPRKKLLSRFGGIAEHALSLLAGKRNERFRATAEKRIIVRKVLDDPVDNTDSIGFIVRELGAQMLTELQRRGVETDELEICAVLDSGEEFTRSWHLEFLEVNELADRVRWQIKAWATTLSVKNLENSFQISQLKLTAANLVLPTKNQQALWGNPQKRENSVARTIERIQGILGIESVFSPVESGGLSPGESYRLAEWGSGNLGRARSGAAREKDIDSKGQARKLGAAGRLKEKNTELIWNGQIPRPWPSCIYENPQDTLVFCLCGEVLEISDDGFFSCIRACVNSAPRSLVFLQRMLKVHDFAGPWIHRGNWSQSQREAGDRAGGSLFNAWMQVDSYPEGVYLLLWISGKWKIVGEYR